MRSRGTFKTGDWVTLRKPPRQIKTLTFQKRYMVQKNPYEGMNCYRIYVEDDAGKVRSFASGFFKPWCSICQEGGWVCEQHPDRGWPDNDPGCAGPGMPCKCNDRNPPWKDPQ